MNPAWRETQHNWLIQLVTKFVALFIIASIAVIVWRWNRMPPLVPLWYSRPWGIDQLAQPIWLFLLPLGGLVLYFINLFVSMYITAEYLIFTQTLFLASFLINFLSFITLVKIIFLAT
jgi:hypothetical protein